MKTQRKLSFIIGLLLLSVAALYFSISSHHPNDIQKSESTVNHQVTKDARSSASEGHPSRAKSIYPSPQFFEDLKKRAVLNPADALRYIEAEVPSLERLSVKFELMKELCTRDPLFLKLMEKLLDPKQYGPFIGAITKEWASKDADTDMVTDSIKTLRDEKLKAGAWGTMTQAFTSNYKFEKAEIMSVNIPTGRVRAGVIANLVAAEAINRPDAAIAFTKPLTDPFETAAAYRAISDIFANHNDSARLMSLLGDAAPEMRVYLRNGLGKIFGANGDVSFLETSANMEGDERNALFLGYVLTAPLSGLQDFVDRIMDSKDMSLMRRAGSIYVERSASLDFGLASKWALESPDAIRNDMLREVFRKWSETDQAATLAWIENHPNGKDKDRALLALSKIMIDTNRVKARQIANRIVDPVTKKLAFVYLAEPMPD